MADQQKQESWTPEQQMQELKRRMGLVMPKLTMAGKPDFKPEPDDVIIAMPPKNGTTWLTHICHQIRMKGQEPEFEDQLEVIPLIEASEMIFGTNPSTLQQPVRPRVFATHLPFSVLAEGGKRVFCFREQKDAVVSAYHFLDSGLGLKGRVNLAVFSQAYIQQVETHMNELLIWWDHRHDDNLLLVFFDDLKEDHAGSVRRIAKYMGVDCDEDTIARVVHTTSHAEMSRISSKFNSRKIVDKLAELVGEELAPDDEFVGRVRKSGGKSGDGKEQLPADIQQRIDQLWQEIVTTKLGFKDLKEMREAWKKEQSAN